MSPVHFLLRAQQWTVTPQQWPSIPRFQGPCRCHSNFMAHNVRDTHPQPQRGSSDKLRGYLALVTRKVNRICFHFKKKYQNISSFPHVVLFPFVGRRVGDSTELNKVDLTHLVPILSATSSSDHFLSVSCTYTWITVLSFLDIYKTPLWLQVSFPSLQFKPQVNRSLRCEFPRTKVKGSTLFWNQAVSFFAYCPSLCPYDAIIPHNKIMSKTL